MEQDLHRHDIEDTRNTKYYFSFITLGVLVGVASSTFLHLLKLVTNLRFENGSLVFFLPVAMVIVNYCYKKLSPVSERGNNLIIDEIHHPKREIPLILIPLILCSTLISHLFGASVGREGSAVQMGGAIGSYLSKLFGHSKRKRTVLLMAGCGAGFGSAIGAPIAGAIFGIEAIYLNVKIRFSTFIECLMASYIAYFTTHLLSTPHSTYLRFSDIDFTWKNIFYSLIAGLAFGVVARFFIALIDFFKTYLNELKRPLLITFIGSITLVACFYLLADISSQRYMGLGIEVIQLSLHEFSSYKDTVYKFFLTVQ